MSHEPNIRVQLAAALARAEAAEARAKKAEAECERLRIDCVTGLFKREQFEPDVAKLVLPHPTNPHPAQLVVADVDYLGLWNDLFGHADGGDIALRGLARTLQESFATHDTLWYRIGGDEFAGLLLMDEQDVEVSLHRARTIYQRLEINDQQPLPPSFVFGHCCVTEMDRAYARLVSECPELHNLLARDVITLRKRLLIEIADSRAYTAKMYHRLLLLTHILERDGARRFEELARWLLKGAGEITQDTIFALADIEDEQDRIPEIEKTLEAIFAAEMQRLQHQLNRSPGIRRPDVMRRQIVLEMSRQLPTNHIRRLF